MNVNSVVGGAGSKSAPLISFNAIVDIDVGLINFVKRDYLSPSVFDVSKFNIDQNDIIREVYFRKELNPLTHFAKDKSNTQLLDDYYKEFIDTKMKDILDLSIATDVINMIDLFNVSNEINASILYYTEEQKEMLDNEDTFKDNEKVSISSLTSYDLKSIYTQYYFRSIEEAEYFSDCQYKTFYFSMCATNLNEENDDLKESDILLNIAKHRNQINIFDLYNRKNLLEERKKNNG